MIGAWRCQRPDLRSVAGTQAACPGALSTGGIGLASRPVSLLSIPFAHGASTATAGTTSPAAALPAVGEPHHRLHRGPGAGARRPAAAGTRARGRTGGQPGHAGPGAGRA